MSKKHKFPKKLIVILDAEGETPIAFETPEDISDQLTDEPAAVYELVAVGKFQVEKHVDAKPVKEMHVAQMACDDVCSACGRTRKWHKTHRPRHIFVMKKQ